MDETFCGAIDYKEGTNPYVIEWGTQRAKEITIVGGEVDGYLTLCEVQVFSSNPPSESYMKYIIIECQYYLIDH